MKRTGAVLAAAALALSIAAGPVAAQIGGVGLPTLPGPGGLADTVRRAPGEVLGRADGGAGDLSPRALLRAAEERLAERLRRDRDVLEPDFDGFAAVRGEVLAVDPGPDALAAAERLGLTVIARESVGDLGVRIVAFRAPEGADARTVLRRLRREAPNATFEFNHVYEPSGAAAAPETRPNRGGPRAEAVALIDTGLDAAHPAFLGVRVEQRGFSGPARPAAHGLATGSLLAHAAAPRRLLVADVYGGARTGGSARAVALAVGWAVVEGAPVVNVSLVGPPNAVMEAAIRAAVARGVLVVAAVGNDGPAAPPRYPAAYPGVIGVTGVDQRGRVLPESGRGAHVDFAALADRLPVASAEGQARARGTSYAAPLVAGRLAELHPRATPQSAARALAVIEREARDAGRKGPDPLYGKGIVRVAPVLQ